MRKTHHWRISLFLIIQLVWICNGGAVFKLQLLNFTNPGGNDHKGNACDVFSDCDNVFDLCIDRSDRTTNDDEKHCDYYRNRTDKMDGDKVIFGRDFKITSSINKQSNPITVSNIPKWPGSVKFKVRVWDNDDQLSGKDDVIDYLSLIIPMTPAKGHGTPLPPGTTLKMLGIRGKGPKTSIFIKTHLYCEPDNYGIGCDVFCKSDTPDTRGRYTCDLDTGDKHCIAGWKGKDCNLLKCVDHECQNNAACNVTDNGYTCICAPGFSGSHCEEALISTAADMFNASETLPTAAALANSNAPGITVSLLIICLLIVAVIFLAVMWRRKRNRKQVQKNLKAIENFENPLYSTMPRNLDASKDRRRTHAPAVFLTSPLLGAVGFTPSNLPPGDKNKMAANAGSPPGGENMYSNLPTNGMPHSESNEDMENTYSVPKSYSVESPVTLPLSDTNLYDNAVVGSTNSMSLSKPQYDYSTSESEDSDHPQTSMEKHKYNYTPDPEDCNEYNVPRSFVENSNIPGGCITYDYPCESLERNKWVTHPDPEVGTQYDSPQSFVENNDIPGGILTYDYPRSLENECVSPPDPDDSNEYDCPQSFVENSLYDHFPTRGVENNTSGEDDMPIYEDFDQQ